VSTQTSKTSTNVTVPRSKHLASTEREATVNEASLRSNCKWLRDSSSTNATIPSSSSAKKIAPWKRSSEHSSSTILTTIKFKTVLEFFHLSNLANASREEAIFLHILYSHLSTQATLLAAILPWSVQRPLRALRAAMNGRARNYSARSAKRKRLSGSPAVSRKRLSGA